MTDAGVIAMGLTVGLRHAFDADHVAAVGTQLGREAAWRVGLRVALLWGSGHACSLLAIAVPVVLGAALLPSWFEQVCGLLAGAALVMLGLMSLGRGTPAAVGSDEPCCGGASRAGLMPMLVGAVHGLGGSSLVAVVASLGLRSPTDAVAYLVLCALGTLVGMALMTTVLALALRRLPLSPVVAATVIRRLSGAVSVVLGLSVLVETM